MGGKYNCIKKLGEKVIKKKEKKTDKQKQTRKTREGDFISGSLLPN